MTCTVVARDERAEPTAVPVDVERWAELAEAAASREGGDGELSLTFVDVGAMTELNAEHMGKQGPTDVLSFPMDDEPMPGVPTLLGDIVICPDVALAQSSDHAGTFDDELALLVVHGLLHVLGHDHAEADETALMRSRELDLLSSLHWGGPPPAGFRQAQD
ncbi:rRNA maturation RNase YbeY [Ilumatobacter nonamiensis]|uniref:rRNA maturation RNase YbeY n=1 Tax=Ilumatobacter nonamiensis TaxID=467093 RepID=UPI0003455AF8|nr:rRNA maturation RNase YbeY [Ilumatobacter nonamiensis]